ncbi:N-acetylglucosamine kinase [Apibacter adventoris]|uniref:N-acetylglucosamine kinase n=1 Tax=Apibacter adventoris TaxID=1679466 RepID=A0A2S8A8D5_9FLAO|nr:N-acetylglucosamine kinase [Apibacter adventoris]PQL90834.1 N-acetylglucosamine kinase [Apibacter adventoris]PQL94970.1 N-acetylglucosamine kinase [Apibacter adventoris]
MILLADSGATKADWVAIDSQGNRLFSSQTNGLSPEAIDKEEMLKRLNERFDIVQNKTKVSKVFFYGAGCGTENMKNIVRSTLKKFFSKAEEIIVEEDTYGAVYATTPPNSKAIVCILGTGSNCSYYDGEKLNQKVLSLGYLLMDDCSGNKLGADLIRAYNFKILPEELSKKLEQEYNMDADYIKVNLYKKPNPNAYLATFAKFIIENKDHEFIQKIVNKQIQTFIDYYIKQYDNCKEVPINFNGSIGFYLKDELEQKLSENDLKIGIALRRPIDGLIDYIIKYKI